MEVCMLKRMMVVLFCFMAFSSHAAEIKLQGRDGFNLYGDYTASARPVSKGVLMLHQCNDDRSMYLGLAKLLAANGISSMSLDFRGYGDSITEELSITAIRSKATSRKHYFVLLQALGLGKHRADDVEIAYQYLVEKLGKEAQVSFIGASCGGHQAVILAQKFKPLSFVFFHRV